MFWVVIIRTIIAATLGWIVGLMLNRIMFAFDEWRFRRAVKRRDLKLVSIR